MKKILFFLFFISNYSFLTAQNTDSVIVFDNESEILNIGKQVYFLEDKEGKLTIEDIQKPEYQSQFKKSEQKNLNFGLNLYHYWIKIIIKNTDLSKEWSVQSIHGLESIKFYKKNEKREWIEDQQGAHIVWDKSKTNNLSPTFMISESPIPQTYYLKIQNQGFPIPLNIVEKEHNDVQNFAKNTFFALMLGIAFFILINNAYLAIAYRNLLYSIYTLLVFSYILGMMSFEGYMYIVYSYFAVFSSASYLYKGIILTIWGSILIRIYIFLFFQIPLKSIWAKGFYVFFVLDVFNLFILQQDFIMGLLSNQLTALFSMIYNITYAYKARKQKQGVSWILLSYFLLFASLCFEVMYINDLIPYRPLISYVTFGIMSEILIFSYALVYKNRQESIALQMEQIRLKEAKDQAQLELLKKSHENQKLIKDQNKMLAQRVEEKTKDLQQAFEEIQVSNEELHQTQEELTSQRDLLEENNYTLELFRTKMTSSIRSAYTIQQAILPPKAKLDEILGEYFIINRPKDQVSGDFYWTNQIDNKKFLIVADCTGHGVSGAFMTMIGNTLLDKIIKVWNIYDPAQILETIHTEIQAVLQQGETGNKDGMDVAVAVLEENPQGFRVEFSGAKRPLYYTETGQIEIEKLLGVRKSVGGFTSPEKRYQTETAILSKNSMIYMASDGYADQNDQNRHSFSEKRFTGMLSMIQENTLLEQKSFLEHALDKHMAGAEQRDDILVLGVRV